MKKILFLLLFLVSFNISSAQWWRHLTVTITWQDNSSDETGFVIERSTDGYNFQRIAYVGANVVTYQDQNLSPGTFYYRVRSYNGTYFSASSNIAKIVLTK